MLVSKKSSIRDQFAQLQQVYMDNKLLTTLLTFLSVLVIKALIAFNDWLFMHSVRKKLLLFLDGNSENATDDVKVKGGRAGYWITSNMTEIKRRIKKSGIQEQIITYTQPTGYGDSIRQQMSVIDNMLYPNEEVLSKAGIILDSVKGFYKNEVIKSFNPFYWLEVVFFFPKAMVSATGLEITSQFAVTFLRIIQIIYWLLGIAFVISNPDFVYHFLASVKI